MKNKQLLTNFFSGDRVALARMISRAEKNQGVEDAILDQVLKEAKSAYRIGITGPPGAGKSTLVDGLISKFRESKKTTGIIAVDPTSPFTGGALLGDRIRMSSNLGDPGVFIRSMATRGSLGGLANSTQEAADVIDAFGYDIIILETVGVGQSELDIVEAADTVVVVLVPESGDSIQAMKAGLMEIGDIFVLNKSDHDNSEQAFMELSSILSLKPLKNDWRMPILQTVAHKTEGLSELFKQIGLHREYLENEQRLPEKRRMRIRKRFRKKVDLKLHSTYWDQEKKIEFEDLLHKLYDSKLTYKQAVDELFNRSYQ